MLLERCNNWRAGIQGNIPNKNNQEGDKDLNKTPKKKIVSEQENITKRRNSERDGESDNIPKKKLAPEHIKRPNKNIKSLPTILEVEEVKGKEREKSPLTTPIGYRNSKRFNRKDYRGLC